MAVDVDSLVERRRLRRRVSFWRIAALVLAVIALLAGGYQLAGVIPGKTSNHVARVNLNGIIVGNDKRQKMLEEIGKSRAAAVLLEIDSPGGGVTASEELYHDLRKLSEKKPIVAVLGSVAASGGYIAALAADRIIARQTSLTGSIGVLVQYPELAQLLNSLGVTVQEVKSAPLKAAPSMFTPASPEAREALQSIVMDSFDWFKGIVTDRRGLSGERLARVSDGRAFTGRQALEAGLVDEIGGEEEARAWLLADRGISRDLPVRDWEPSSGPLTGLGLARGMLAGLADTAGFPAFAQQIRAGAQSALDLRALDGLVAIWHPSLQD